MNKIFIIGGAAILGALFFSDKVKSAIIPYTGGPEMITAKEAFDIIIAVKSDYPQFAYIPDDMLLGMMETESAFNPYAVSSANAKGLMQVLPGTFKWINETYKFYTRAGDNFIYDPYANVRAALAYLDFYYKRWNDWNIVLHIYNEGEGNYKKGRRVHAYVVKVAGYEAKWTGRINSGTV